MPYIRKEQRHFIDTGDDMISAGELNYEFTQVILEYLGANRYTYATMNDIIGALESAKMEFYRRVVVPYEEKKLKENGDVYPEMKHK